MVGGTISDSALLLQGFMHGHCSDGISNISWKTILTAKTVLSKKKMSAETTRTSFVGIPVIKIFLLLSNSITLRFSHNHNWLISNYAYSYSHTVAKTPLPVYQPYN